VRRLKRFENLPASGWVLQTAYENADFANGDQARFLAKLKPVIEKIELPLNNFARRDSMVCLAILCAKHVRDTCMAWQFTEDH